MMLILQCLGAQAMLVAWVIQERAGRMTPWDRWLLPVCAAIVGGSALAVALRPVLEDRLRAVPVATFNLYLVVTLHATLAYTSGDDQCYQVLSDLYWIPLGYGCAFVFLNLRTALVVSSLTAFGIFAPFIVMKLSDALPPWVVSSGPLLPQVGLSHVMFVVLLAAVVRLRTSHEQAQADAQTMRTLAETDALTGLPNRRAVSDRLQAAMALAQRTGQPLSVGLIDVDRFKLINDRFGHATGDDVLRVISGTMYRELRASDVLGRWGGEEFLMMAPCTSREAAAALAERVRGAVAAQGFAHGELVTISIGLAECRPGDQIDTLLRRADEALYRAKNSGRNRIEVPVAVQEQEALA